MTPAQLAVAWVLAKQPGFTALIGAKTLAQLDDARAALDRSLSADDLRAIDALEFAGERYASEHMKHLDSER
jgi:aryl-alcohol dehydrogenase-like predicted oxidoreductase